MGTESKYFKTYPDTSSSHFSVAGAFVILRFISRESREGFFGRGVELVI